MLLHINDKYGQPLSFQTVIFKMNCRIKTILLELCVYFLHLIGYVPVHHIRRFFYRIAGMKIGKGSSLHMGIRMYNPNNITIGEDSIIGENCVLDGRNILSIGNHVDIASEVMIYNSEHDIKNSLFNPTVGKVIIEDFVFIGPRAIILSGVTIGKGAVIAAGAVITKNIPSLLIVGGVPAHEIGRREVKNLGYKLGRASWFR
ncbi:acyltransferase [Candidatus Roizmanbacteria bacterium CG_4_10_14_0_8_um_filter_33_9]|uniref:Acyltransferase n=1 Tax=Candidatus Roizmanbacteria bacterium CG_4_10_14_0_8_um_filter_33_9 TaxID=1974826 RepID=A0A2M7QKY6_9BACT|nr:MAG: acyltransferase [Candidatus Roizmanbacteria bacterium CG_4_10_14_0_8_um_filter_33_9]